MADENIAALSLTPEAIAEAGTVGRLDVDPAVAEYALGLGDDALILAQRLGEWISNAPELEEDMALANIGLDLLGQARALLSYAGAATGRTEDDLAYLRDENEFRCRQLFEQPNGDFAQTIAKQLIASLYFDELYRRLSDSSDLVLRSVAQKAVKEIDYHLDHSTMWLRRLALGTLESRTRMIAGLVAIWPFVGELFLPYPAAELPGVAVDPASLRAGFDERMAEILASADLEQPDVKSLSGDGRDGIHSEEFGHLLAEMQVLARRHPGAMW